MHAKSLQSCLTLCDPMDHSPPGSSVHGILQARIFERASMLYSRGSSWPRDQTQVCCIAGSFFTIWATRGFPGGSSGKDPTCQWGDVRDMGSVPGLGRSPGEGNSNPLQNSCLENSMDRGAWWAMVHGVTKNWTGLIFFSLSVWPQVKQQGRDTAPPINRNLD